MIALTPSNPATLLDSHTAAPRLHCGRAKFFSDVRSGLIPEPVRFSARISRWPETEIDQIARARIAGATDDDIRALVVEIHAARRIQ